WGRSTVNSQLVGVAQQHFNVGSAKSLRVRLPSKIVQDHIAAFLCAMNELIENNRRRIEVLEETARAIYREWFLYFRHPNHTKAKFVESQLGLIPDGWEITTVRGLASSERNAVTGGPFGSKLGRKDYVDDGIPVIRGTNLRVGGGFDESDL